MDSLSSEAHFAFSHTENFSGSSVINFPKTMAVAPVERQLDKMVGTTAAKITSADSACLIDMHLRNFINETRRECLRPTTDDRMKIEDAVTARTQKALADPELHSSHKEIWAAWDKESFPHTLNRIAPQITMAPAFTPQP